jgi:hypothetical protein
MESLVSDTPAGDGKIANLFLQCTYKGQGGVQVSHRFHLHIPLTFTPPPYTPYFMYSLYTNLFQKGIVG